MEKRYKLLNGDCLDKLKELEENSIDSIVTDPPYGLEFMGKEWDSFKTGRISKYKEGGSLDVDAIQSRKGKGGAGPSYTKRAAKKCRKCGKQAWSGSPCKCKTPDFEIDNSTQLTFQEFNEAWARECYRVLKPGGYLLAFGGSRMYHRLAVGIEDAGFEIRDQIMWIYGSGFPKSHNIGKAVDKLQGNQRQVVGSDSRTAKDACWGKADPNSPNYDGSTYGVGEWDVTKGNSPWEGWGTALKPAHEPIVMARKPFKGSVAENVLEYGVGGINVDGCRIDAGNDYSNRNSYTNRETNSSTFQSGGQMKSDPNDGGRFPANIIFECTCDNPIVKENTNQPYTYKDKNYSEQGFLPNVNAVAPYNYNDTNSGVVHTDPNCPCYILDKQSGVRKGFASQNCNNQKLYGGNALNSSVTTRDGFKEGFNDTGGASRFFYCPKVSKKERNEGVEGEAKPIKGRDEGQDKTSIAYKARPTERANIHPTVKPVELMTYLIRLVTPKDGIVLDPFMGSGSTGKAAMREGFQFVGIEREQEYMEIAEQRIDYEYNKRKFF